MRLPPHQRMPVSHQVLPVVLPLTLPLRLVAVMGLIVRSFSVPMVKLERTVPVQS